jgi:hypothetical protein
MNSVGLWLWIQWAHDCMSSVGPWLYEFSGPVTVWIQWARVSYFIQNVQNKMAKLPALLSCSLGSARFEYWPGHQLAWPRFFYLIPSGKFRNGILNKATYALQLSFPRPHVMSVTYSIVKYTINEHITLKITITYNGSILISQKTVRMLWRRWEHNIKMNLQEVGREGMNCIAVAQDRGRWWALMNAVMNLRVP